MKSVAGLMLLLLVVAYAGVQVYLTFHPPLRWFSHTSIEGVRPGEPLWLGIHLETRHRLPYRIISVVTDPAEFKLERACLYDGAAITLFSGERGTVLPIAYRERCQPLQTAGIDWEIVSLLLQGVVTGAPSDGHGPAVEITYRTLGWPHRMVIKRDLYSLAQ